MALRLVIAPAARDDLAETVGYIAAEDPAAAGNMLRRIEHALKLLTDRPYLGPPVIRPLRKGLRKHTVSPYLLYYRVADTELQLVRVLHSSRDLDQILKQLP